MNDSKPAVGRVSACPLCGGPNACAPARCGSVDAPCWCGQATFAPALLARVPDGARGVACVCAACAAEAAGDAVGDDDSRVTQPRDVP